MNVQPRAIERGNRLLSALTPEDADILRPLLEPVELVRDVTLVTAGEAASHVWFPDEGLISIVALDEDGATIEVTGPGAPPPLLHARPSPWLRRV